MVTGTRYQVPGTWFLVLKLPVSETRYWYPGTARYPTRTGTWYLVPVKYLVPGTGIPVAYL